MTRPVSKQVAGRKDSVRTRGRIMMLKASAKSEGKMSKKLAEFINKAKSGRLGSHTGPEGS